MNRRISLILQSKNITPAQLADELGVQRSGISHIINGRNKPSLDFIQKIIKRYPDISMNWLIFGEGQMMNPYPSQNTTPENKRSDKLHQKLSTMQLFVDDERSDIEDKVEESAKTSDNGSSTTDTGNGLDKQEINEERKLIELSMPKNTSENRINNSSKSDLLEKIVNKEITRIVIFYKDKTFSEYYPE